MRFPRLTYPKTRAAGPALPRAVRMANSQSPARSGLHFGRPKSRANSPPAARCCGKDSGKGCASTAPNGRAWQLIPSIACETVRCGRSALGGCVVVPGLPTSPATSLFPVFRAYRVPRPDRRAGHIRCVAASGQMDNSCHLRLGLIIVEMEEFVLDGRPARAGAVNHLA